jgi:hypothetical protein
MKDRREKSRNSGWSFLLCLLPTPAAFVLAQCWLHDRGTAGAVFGICKLLFFLTPVGSIAAIAFVWRPKGGIPFELAFVVTLIALPPLLMAGSALLSM